MHVSPSDFRTVQRDGVLLYFATLDDVTYALAHLPDSGSGGTFVEDWCARPHWAFTVTGDVEMDFDGGTLSIPPGSALYVPDGLRHRFRTPGAAWIAGFERASPGEQPSDEQLRQAGFEIVRAPARAPASVAIVRPRPERPPEDGEIVAATRRMGDLLFTRVRFGRRAGYTSDPCDAPHWGVVVSGGVVIEWEDDVEVLTAGDVFRCPAGPPGHRLLAAEPAVVLDFTPIEAFSSTERLVEWRRPPAEQALAEPVAVPRPDVAVLV